MHSGKVEVFSLVRRGGRRSHPKKGAHKCVWQDYPQVSGEMVRHARGSLPPTDGPGVKTEKDLEAENVK